MSSATFSHEQIIRHAQFTPEDRAEIQQRRSYALWLKKMARWTSVRGNASS